MQNPACCFSVIIMIMFIIRIHIINHFIINIINVVVFIETFACGIHNFACCPDRDTVDNRYATTRPLTAFCRTCSRALASRPSVK